MPHRKDCDIQNNGCQLISHTDMELGQLELVHVQLDLKLVKVQLELKLELV